LNEFHHLSLLEAAIFAVPEPECSNDSLVVPVPERVGMAIQDFTGLLQGQNIGVLLGVIEPILHMS